MLDFTTSVGLNLRPVRQRLESDNESPPSLEPSCDLSVSSEENCRDPAPDSNSHTSGSKLLPFSSFSDASTSCAGSSHERNEFKVSTVVKALHVTKEKRVRFDTCAVRFMPLIAGDHPDCVEGPPLTIDWEPIQEVTFPVDYYEQNRLKSRSPYDLRVGGIDRRRLLRGIGESDERIREAQRESRTVRLQREKTLARLKSDKLDEVQELIARKVGRMFHSKVILKTKY